jgi:hypothetical protein
MFVCHTVGIHRLIAIANNTSTAPQLWTFTVFTMSNILASLPTTTTSLQIKFTVDPTSAAAFFAALKPVQAYVITLPEFVSLDIYHNPSMPGEFKFTEVWNASVEWIMKVAII